MSKKKLVFIENMDYYPYEDVKVKDEKRRIMKLFLELGFEDMSKLEKEIYFQHNYLGLSHKDISLKLNITKVQSRKALYRANKKIKLLAKKITNLSNELNSGD